MESLLIKINLQRFAGQFLAMATFIVLAMTVTVPLPALARDTSCEASVSAPPLPIDKRLLPYVYHKEILDNPRVPDKIRQSVLQSLAFVERTFSGMKNVIASHVVQFADKTQSSRVIEVGSGSGYGLFHVTEDHKFRNIRFTLSDLFPDVARWKKLVRQRDNLDAIETPVDMTHLDETLPLPPQGERESIILLNTISIHHLPDTLVRQYFEEAEKIHAHIMIVEIDRTLKNMLLTSAAVVPAMLAPFSRGLGVKERLNMLLWGWIVPVMPAIYIHDSVVSTLRQRTESQWRALFKDLDFEVEYNYGQGPLKNFSVIKAFNRHPP